jgi:hypothetical protein
MNEIWERVLANSFSGIHKSKIICNVAGRVITLLVPCRLPGAHREKKCLYLQSDFHGLAVLYNEAEG